jgi:hypothetical protein
MLVLAHGAAPGQDLKAAQACTRLGDDASRLACYDAALGHNAALGAAKPPAAPQSGVGMTDVQTKFGDNGRLHPDTKADLPKSLTVQILQAMPLPYGLYQLTLENGQVWRTTQADSALAFKANDTVAISRRVLGGYEISLTGRNASVNATRIK